MSPIALVSLSWFFEATRTVSSKLSFQGPLELGFRGGDIFSKQFRGGGGGLDVFAIRFRLSFLRILGNLDLRGCTGADRNQFVLLRLLHVRCHSQQSTEIRPPLTTALVLATAKKSTNATDHDNSDWFAKT
jgi:hypothetical protein